MHDTFLLTYLLAEAKQTSVSVLFSCRYSFTCVSCVFVSCRNNLHIVLCMSPVGSAFRSRCRMFPSLVNCCTIDWFIEWPREALLSVSRTAFEPVDFGKGDLKVRYTHVKLYRVCQKSKPDNFCVTLSTASQFS